MAPGHSHLHLTFVLQGCADLCKKVLALLGIPTPSLSPNWQEQQALLTQKGLNCSHSSRRIFLVSHMSQLFKND